ncbi:MAG: hypothetical protein FVQ85_20705 [Planctomycetes bacterium]|nr:hypothetical protein [Planctomycetota bacterium]
MGNNNIINGNCWVAYFDILGFRNRVEILPWQSVWKTYKDILMEIQRNSWAVSCKWFSDTFVFYTPDDSQNSFCDIEGSLRSFFRHMFVIKTIPFRGCLTVGKVYIDLANNVFFGQGFLEAHDVAENEEWIGYVLTENATEKANEYPAKERSVLDVLLQYYYREYDVPFKDNKKHRLVVPNLKIDLNSNSQQAVEHQIQLWKALIIMEKDAKRFIYEKIKKEKIAGMARCREYKQVLRKYKNTKNFLLEVFPRLKDRIKGKNKQVSP